MDVFQSYCLEKPLAKLSEVRAGAKTTWSDKDQLPLWPEQFSRGCHKQRIDIRLTMHNLLEHRHPWIGLGDFEIGRIRNYKLGASLFGKWLKQGGRAQN
jgi:hypothetical protein